jgi:predicted alpha-1,2-mannosidase
MGGNDAFVAKLDSMFTDAYYWHGNEPGHQTPFMFNWAAAPWKTQQHVRSIMTDEYGLGPGGMCGNEDGGQMSSWYVFASVGFYPVCPGTPYYAIASPTYPKAVFNLENGAQFTIIANNASPENIYIQSATLNGAPYNKSYITHKDILSGSILIFEMGNTPNKAWASLPESLPPI